MSPHYSYVTTLPRPPKPPPRFLPMAPRHRVLPLRYAFPSVRDDSALSAELRLFFRSPAQRDGHPPESLLTACPSRPVRAEDAAATETLTQHRRQPCSRGRPRPLADRPRPRASVGLRGFRLWAARAGSVALPWREPGAGPAPAAPRGARGRRSGGPHLTGCAAALCARRKVRRGLPGPAAGAEAGGGGRGRGGRGGRRAERGLLGSPARPALGEAGAGGESLQAPPGRRVLRVGSGSL